MKEEALHRLALGGDLYRWNTAEYRSQLSRRKVLFELEKKLLSDQPDPVQVKRRRSYRCPWRIGDVFAYKLESELAKSMGLSGRYILIQKIDEGNWYPHHIEPIVYVKITNNSVLPKDVNEYNKLEYVQISYSKYDERFFPIDGSRPAEDIAEKSKIKYEVDEYGLLPHYRLMIVATKKKDIPKNLIYIGRLKDIAFPEKELIPHVKLNI